MTRIVFLRHFETEVENDRPAAEWQLSEGGKQAMLRFLKENDFSDLDRVYTSPERKAKVTAEAVAEQAGVELVETETLAEVDRSGEGFIDDHDRYLEMVQTYLKNPSVSFNWENRSSVKQRIKKFVENVRKSDERVLAATHGMFLATLLTQIRDTGPYPLWQEIEFGELIELSRNELVASIDTSI